MRATDPRIERLGDSALLIRVGDSIDDTTNRITIALSDVLRSADLPHVRDIAPAYASVCVRYDIASIDFASLCACLQPLIDSTTTVLGNDDDSIIEIPVCYGGEFGPDLDAVAAHASISADRVVDLHIRAEYEVAMLGFMPGFPYLRGLDATLYTPRLATPRTRVPAGSVAIGGAQTGIYPRELPGGWNIIGRTPLVLFDPARDVPALLQPGRRIRFVRIDSADFAALKR